MGDALDRISELPDSIKQEILFRLPAHEDAIRMSFLSKQWQTLWNSLPAYHFDFNSETGEPLSYYYQTGHRGRKWKRSSFRPKKPVTMSALDKSLRTLHQHEDDQTKIINYFRLRGRVPTQTQTWHVDRWIKLVTKHFVKELHLCFNYVAGVPRYRFPPASFDAGSLVVLSLSHCVLDQALIQEGTSRFCCLKELRLSHVDLNGLVEDLVSRCPSLKTLELYRCEKTRHLQLDDLKKLIETVTIQF